MLGRRRDGFGIKEIDVDLVMTSPPGLPLPSNVLAKDTSTGSVGVIGGRGNCFRWPMPIAAPATLVVVATDGGGMALVQMFVK